MFATAAGARFAHCAPRLPHCATLVVSLLMFLRSIVPSRLRLLTVLAIACLGATPLACIRHASTDDPRILSAWTHALYGAIRVERLSPPVASRLSAYAMLTLYAGLAAVHPELRALQGSLHEMPTLPIAHAARAADVDGTLIAIAAERIVLDSLLREALPTTTAQLHRLADSLTTARLASGVSSARRAGSDSLARVIALAMLAWSRADGFDGTRGRAFVPLVAEALWLNDSPATNYTTQNLSAASELVTLDNPANQARASNMSDRGLILSRPKSPEAKTVPAVNMAGATEPYWHEVRPFVLTAWNSCAIPEPPAYSRDTASAMYRAAREVFDTHASLTPEQRTIAYYWADNAGESGTPVGHWLSIASQMLSERQLSAVDAVRLLAATAVSQADAYIAAWGYKYQYNLLRPRTYLRRVVDSTWEPLIPTPPFPEHPAGHSTQSAAAATVLTAMLGETPFTDSTSISLGHSVRHFASFRTASDEAGMSRIYGGIHYPTGNEVGGVLGRCIGAQVATAFRLSTVTARP